MIGARARARMHSCVSAIRLWTCVLVRLVVCLLAYLFLDLLVWLPFFVLTRGHLSHVFKRLQPIPPTPVNGQEGGGKARFIAGR